MVIKSDCGSLDYQENLDNKLRYAAEKEREMEKAGTSPTTVESFRSIFDDSRSKPKRMGSASSNSSNVVCEDESSQSFAKQLDNQQTHRFSNNNMIKCKRCSFLQEEVVNLQVRLEQSQKKLVINESKLNDLNEIVTASEDEIFQLTEENGALQTRLNGAISRPTSTNSTQLLSLKQREIDRLNHLISMGQEDLKALKQKYKSKLKQIKTENSDQRQQSAINMFELKDELANITSENKLLKELLMKNGIPMRSCSPNTPRREDNSDPEANSRAHIIIELSEQISDLETKVTTLEMEIASRDETIARLTTASAGISPRQARSMIAIETEMASQELADIESELRNIKLKKKKGKRRKTESQVTTSADITINSRGPSAISKDSGIHSDYTPRWGGAYDKDDPISELLDFTSTLGTSIPVSAGN